MEQIERITRMEKLFDECRKAADELEKALDRYSGMQSSFDELDRYYSGGLWLKDFEDDEAGRISDIKRGVLSEDGLYDLLERRANLDRIKCRNEKGRL